MSYFLFHNSMLHLVALIHYWKVTGDMTRICLAVKSWASLLNETPNPSELRLLFCEVDTPLNQAQIQ